jgi:ZIP family zinc transporter
MTRLLLYATGTGLATALGTLPVLLRGELSRRGYDTLLGLGAGLMLAAATLGLLPTALATRLSAVAFLTVLVGFVAGAVLLGFVDRLIPGHEEHSHDEHAARARHQGLLIVSAMSLHRVPESIAIGASFRTSSLAALLIVAVTVQNAIEGAVMAGPLARGGVSRVRLVAIVAATGLVVPLAAAVGYSVSAALAGAMPFVLALAAGALVYLACGEIIPESQSHGNARPASVALLVGIVVMMVVKYVVGE